MTDQRPTQLQEGAPMKSWLSDWFEKQSSLVKAIITLVLGALLAQLPPQLSDSLKPGLPAAQQQQLDTAAKRGEVMADVLGGTFPELIDPAAE